MRASSLIASLLANAGRLHRVRVALHVGLYEAHVVLGAVLAQLHAEVRHALGDVGLAHDLRHRALHPRHDLARRAGGRLQPDDGGDIEIRVALLDRARHIGQAWRAPRGADGEYLQLAGLDVRRDVRDAGPADLHFAAEESRDQRAAA